MAKQEAFQRAGRESVVSLLEGPEALVFRVDLRRFATGAERYQAEMALGDVALVRMAQRPLEPPHRWGTAPVSDADWATRAEAAECDAVRARRRLARLLDNLEGAVPESWCLALSPETGLAAWAEWSDGRHEAVALETIPLSFVATGRGGGPWARRANPLLEPMRAAAQHILRQSIAYALPEGMEPTSRALTTEHYALERMSREVWNALWRRVLPHLAPEPLRLARACNRSADLYRLLVQHPWWCSLVDQARPVGILLTTETARGLAPGQSLRAVLHHLLATHPWISSRAREHWARRGPETEAFPLPSAGFMAWARGVRWTPAHVPGYQSGSLPLVLGAYLLGPDLDPNRVRALARPSEWHLLNFCLRSYSTSDWAVRMLVHPAASVRAVRRYFGDDLSKRGTGLMRIRSVLDDAWDQIVRLRATPEGAARLDRARSMARVLEIAAQGRFGDRLETVHAQIQQAMREVRAYPAMHCQEVQGDGHRLRFIGDRISLACERTRMRWVGDGRDEAFVTGERAAYALETVEGAPVATVVLDRMTLRVVSITGRYGRSMERVAGERVAELLLGAPAGPRVVRPRKVRRVATPSVHTDLPF